MAQTYEPRLASSLPAVNDEIIEMYQPMVEGMAQYGGALCDAYTAMGSEWLNFINHRIHSDMSLAGTLAKCRTPQDLMREWSTFMTATAEDYRSELTKLAELNLRASQRAASAIHANGDARAVRTPRGA